MCSSRYEGIGNPSKIGEGGGGGGSSKEKQVKEEKYGAKLELPGEADKVCLWWNDQFWPLNYKWYVYNTPTVDVCWFCLR